MPTRSTFAPPAHLANLILPFAITHLNEEKRGAFSSAETVCVRQLLGCSGELFHRAKQLT